MKLSLVISIGHTTPLYTAINYCNLLNIHYLKEVQKLDIIDVS